MDSVKKLRILPKFSTDAFLRKVWKAFAEENAPIELFDQDLGAVKEKEYEVLIDTISADVSYNVSIGYNRKEPYIAYETYYENEPYITTERYYDKTIQAYRTREITKDRKVEKQRQVTKYKTVTDWSLFSDSRSINSTTAYVTNKNYNGFDMEAFRKSFRRAERNEFTVVAGNEAVEFKIDSSANAKAEKKHSNAIQHSVENSLLGDCHKDLDVTYSVTDRASALYKVPMYKTSVNFKGKTYTKYAFPFGDELKVYGDKIENEQSFESVKRQTNALLDNHARQWQ